MSEYIHIQRDVHPDAKLPEDTQTIVCRYMDKWKFESLLKQRSLYLCRGDKLQDRFEGTYSRNQISEQNEWLKEMGHKKFTRTHKT